MYMSMRDAEGTEGTEGTEGRMQDHTNNKAKQHSTPKAVVTLPKKNGLPRMGFEPRTLYRQNTLPTCTVPVSRGIRIVQC